MKQSTKRFLSLATSFFLFVFTLVFYFSLIVPANTEEQSIKAKMISRQDFIDTQKNAIKQVQGLIGSYKGEGQLQEVVTSILPASEDSAGAFAQIEGLVEANRLITQIGFIGSPVDVASLDTTPGGKSVSLNSMAKPFSSVDFQLKITGTYDDFKAFLRNLETNVRIFDVKKIILQPAGKSGQNVYSYDITVTTYYQKP